MTTRLPPLNSLRAFTVAAKHLSFKRAATELYVTPAAISHQVKTLEHYLGVELFRRTTRGLVLTDHGVTCLPYFEKGFKDLASGVAQLQKSNESVSLRVGVPISLATRWLVPRLPGFLKAHPGVEVQIIASTHTIDSPHLSPDNALLLDDAGTDEVDVAVRFGTGSQSGFQCHRLFTVEVMPFCCPRLQQGPPALSDPKDLMRLTLLHDDSILLAEQPSYWDRWLSALDLTHLDRNDAVHFSHSGLALDAAVNGMGIVATVSKLAEADVAEGRLIAPFEFRVSLPLSYYLTYRSERIDEPLIDAFTRWILTERDANGATQA